MSGCSDKIVQSRQVLADNRGFSLTELVVVMGIFLTVMLITSSAFKTIANSSSQQSKLAETQIGGIVGLELLRSDLEQAGFGLPWTYQATPIGYQEAVGTPASAYNDAPPEAPRPLTSGFNKTLFGTYTASKYIVIKSAVIAPNATSKKWTNVSFLGGVKTIKEWGDIHRDFAADDRVIIIKNNIITTPPSRQLVVSTKGTLVPSGTFSAPFSTYSTLLDQHLDGDTFQIYGIAPSTTASIKMPFNRSDYYLRIPMNGSVRDMPDYCATNTGVLYKATIKHADGTRDPMPLLDCVADLQIVYGLDTDGGGRVNFHATAAPATADEQRTQLKELRVYLLVQDGKKDLTFNYPSPVVAVGESFDGGATIAGRYFDLTTIPDYRNYRWKVYTIVVRPKNLIQ